NGVLAAVHGIRANDEIEAMLAVQMVATHFAATRALRRLKGSDTVPQQDSNGNLAVKLLRTFAAQTEALQRYRGKGHQKVTVEHVHVHTRGQAIVGSVSQTGGGRDNDENRRQPHAPENAGAITFVRTDEGDLSCAATQYIPSALVVRTRGSDIMFRPVVIFFTSPKSTHRLLGSPVPFIES
ncbi:MAG: hypothetical protein WBD65_08585, partial [Methylocella sp.]